MSEVRLPSERKTQKSVPGALQWFGVLNIRPSVCSNAAVDPAQEFGNSFLPYFYKPPIPDGSGITDCKTTGTLGWFILCVKPNVLGICLSSKPAVTAGFEALTQSWVNWNTWKEGQKGCELLWLIALAYSGNPWRGRTWTSLSVSLVSDVPRIILPARN